jgi:alkylated DNA repair dioxygenase AlkB
LNSLFDIPPELPEGFFYYPDFISVEEESALIAQIQKHSLNNMIFHGFEAKRKVKSFGYDYHFDNKSLTKGTPIPEEFNWLINNVAKRLNLLSEKFATLLLTEYDTGTVINWHRDAPPFEKIAGISLLSDCTFKLRPYDKIKQTLLL